MRVVALTAGFFLALCGAALADGCGDALDCHPAKPAHRLVHHAMRPHAPYYGYAAMGPVPYRHSGWRVAPNDGRVPLMAGGCGCMPAPMPAPCCAPAYAPPVYGPPMAYYAEPETYVDPRSFNGGVGSAADGGGGGFEDGYGQLHYAQGGGLQNGPTYNSYNQSFQYNPSVAGPFQNRLMGGFAPPTGAGK